MLEIVSIVNFSVSLEVSNKSFCYFKLEEIWNVRITHHRLISFRKYFLYISDLFSTLQQVKLCLELLYLNVYFIFLHF